MGMVFFHILTDTPSWRRSGVFKLKRNVILRTKFRNGYWRKNMTAPLLNRLQNFPGVHGDQICRGSLKCADHKWRCWSVTRFTALKLRWHTSWTPSRESDSNWNWRLNWRQSEERNLKSLWTTDHRYRSYRREYETIRCTQSIGIMTRESRGHVYTWSHIWHPYYVQNNKKWKRCIHNENRI